MRFAHVTKGVMLALGMAGGALAATPALAREGEGLKAHDVLLRVRAIVVAPNDSTGGIEPALPNDRLRIGNAVMPEVDVTWMATKHVGFELIAATTKHSAYGKQGVTAGIGKVASTRVLPPTLTAQYHFNSDGKIRPYAGFGVNYTVFWNEKATDGLQAAVGSTKVHMSDSVGWAAQAGIDIDLNKKFFVNFDAKYIDMHTNAHLYTTALGPQTVKVDLNPVVVGMGFGIRL
jgi:outer membrane protein